jgi:PKD repeat protein
VGCTPGTIGVPDAGDRPSISADSRFVAFGYGLVGVHDTCLGAPAGCTPGTVWVGVGTSAAINADARFVAFASEASDLVAGDTNGTRDVFLASTAPGDPPPPPNAPPVAAFTFTCGGLTCTFDGSGSSDPDGTIASHAWDFGDGTTVSGTTVSHTYAAADTYSVTLTVTDNGGATGAQSQSVTVSQPTIHVGDLDRASTSQGSGWTATVTITVHAGNHAPVASAVVSGSWSAGGTGSCTTNGSGQCTLSKSGIPRKTGSVTFMVGPVTHATLTYASAANHDPDGDSTGTSITVRRP